MNSFVARGLLLSGLLLSVTASADVMLGAKLGRQYLDVQQTAPGVDVSDNISSNTGLGLIVGIGQPGGGSRIVVEWTSLDIGDDAGLDLLNISYNHFFPPLPSSSSLKLRPFVGGELGYGALDVDAQPAYNAGDDMGVLFGARVGLNLVVSERAEIELGARYSAVNLEAELSGKTPAAGTARYAVENNSGWWLGFNIGL